MSHIKARIIHIIFIPWDTKQIDRMHACMTLSSCIESIKYCQKIDYTNSGIRVTMENILVQWEQQCYPIIVQSYKH